MAAKNANHNASHKHENKGVGHARIINRLTCESASSAVSKISALWKNTRNGGRNKCKNASIKENVSQ